MTNLLTIWPESTEIKDSVEWKKYRLKNATRLVTLPIITGLDDPIFEIIKPDRGPKIISTSENGS